MALSKLCLRSKLNLRVSPKRSGDGGQAAGLYFNKEDSFV